MIRAADVTGKVARGLFANPGAAVATGTVKAKPSKACHLPGINVAFVLELLPDGASGPPLETSLIG